MDQIVAWLDSYRVDLSTVLATFGLLLGASLIIVLVNRLLKHWLQLTGARIGLRSNTIVTFARLVTITLWLVTLLLVLDLWGIGVGGLWTLMVSVATIIGVGFLATWAMVSNVTASLFLAICVPFALATPSSCCRKISKVAPSIAIGCSQCCARTAGLFFRFPTICSFKEFFASAVE